MSAPIPVALPLVQGARVRMLGVTTKERLEAIPDVPPLAEIGVPGYNAPSWFMLVAPARTPRAIIDKLHLDLRAVLGEADVREEFIMRQGLIPVRSPPPDELKRFVATEIVRLYRVPEILTLGRFPDARESDSTWRTQEVRHVGSDTIAPRFWCVPAAWFGEEDERRPSGPSASGARRNL
jgi:hypothetical protein